MHTYHILYVDRIDDFTANASHSSVITLFPCPISDGKWSTSKRSIEDKIGMNNTIDTFILALKPRFWRIELFQ